MKSVRELHLVSGSVSLHGTLISSAVGFVNGIMVGSEAGSVRRSSTAISESPRRFSHESPPRILTGCVASTHVASWARFSPDSIVRVCPNALSSLR